MDCSHPVARTERFIQLSSSWKGKNVTNFSEWVLVMGINSDDFETSRRTQSRTHILFTTVPKHSSLSHTLRINISQALPSMRPTNQQCMTAPESCCSLRMPDSLIAASPLTKADCQRPAFDICMGLVTRNVGIIHISLTGPMMYVYCRVVRRIDAN